MSVNSKKAPNATNSFGNSKLRLKIMVKNSKLTEQGPDLAHLTMEQQDSDRKRAYQEHKLDSLTARLRSGDRTAAA